MIARNDDSGSGHFTAKKFVVVQPEEHPAVYRSVLSHVEIPLPGDPMRMTAMPNAVEGKGIWAAAGVNAANVGMTATETITSNPRVLGADPLVVYQPARGAARGARRHRRGGHRLSGAALHPHRREGVERLGKLLETYGTYEMNGIAFQDVNEIWWLETIGGHHWMARRVPDDSYVVMPNQLGIDAFDLDDAFGAQENHLCSADLRGVHCKVSPRPGTGRRVRPSCRLWQPHRFRPRLQHAPRLVHAAYPEPHHLGLGWPRCRLYPGFRRPALVHGA